MTSNTTAWAGLLLAAISPLAAGEPPVADRAAIETHVRACAMCHGEQGRSRTEAYAPSIAGKPAGYLTQQLQNFRDGRRQNLVMQPMLAFLADDYLREMAEYYAAQRPAPTQRETHASAAALALGRKLVERGDPARDLPACQSCHGEALLGVQPAIPGLAALSSDYLTAQLGAWRAGTRAALAPDCMRVIAERLSPEEIAAVTAWVASRPAAATQAPATVVPGELPLRCAGVP